MAGDGVSVPDPRRGLRWGLLAGLVLGVPAGTALKATDYPSDELYLWWAVLGAAYVGVILVVVALVLRGRRALAGGLAVGATVGMGVVPLLVVVDIVTRSA